mgnify:CR=1 FL=1|tara:strand:- start:1246 stop:1746 length:501 start_codon:yes stop_codon:yes gene_type:complete
MENKINTKIASDLLDKMQEIKNYIQNIDIDDKNRTDIVSCLDNVRPIVLTKDDFLKRKRVKTCVPNYLKCKARRANGEQCTRKRKNDMYYCGTHEKNRPHGEIEEENNVEYKKVEVWVEEINGIIYYVDNFHNVYKTEDILSNKPDPDIISRYKIDSDNKICMECN